jgi:hypothetical protein
MALTYAESAQLMTDPAFVARVKVACMTFADYIINEASTTTAHNTRMKWATQTMQSPDAAAAQIAQPVVMDPNVQADGSAIDDATLQIAVESTLNKLM